MRETDKRITSGDYRENCFYSSAAGTITTYVVRTALSLGFPSRSYTKHVAYTNITPIFITRHPVVFVRARDDLIVPKRTFADTRGRALFLLIIMGARAVSTNAL